LKKAPKEVREYLASIGSQGGKAKGKSKVRGDAEYYKRISQKAAEARKAKRVPADWRVLPCGCQICTCRTDGGDCRGCGHKLCAAHRVTDSGTGSKK
jgi:hypothetical protein